MHFKASRTRATFAFVLTVSCFVVSSCTKNPDSFSAWMNSEKPLSKSKEIARKESAPEVSFADEIEVLKIVGDGTASPFVALEQYFSKIPTASVLSSSEQSGAIAKLFIASITHGEKLKTTASDSPIIFERVWTFQLFRTLPLEKRTALLNSPLADRFRDSSSPGDLLQVEGKGTDREILDLRNHLFNAFDSTQTDSYNAFLRGLRTKV
jgi:hypothetical protein